MHLSASREVLPVHRLELLDRPKFINPGKDNKGLWLSETESDFPVIRITLKVSD